MAGYTGKIQGDPSGVSAYKIDNADKGARQSLKTKLELIVAYMRGTGQAQATCPDASTWNDLAYGREPRLPSPAVMRLYATEQMHAAVRAGSTYYQVYWQAAAGLLNRSVN